MKTYFISYYFRGRYITRAVQANSEEEAKCYAPQEAHNIEVELVG